MREKIIVRKLLANFLENLLIKKETLIFKLRKKPGIPLFLWVILHTYWKGMYYDTGKIRSRSYFCTRSYSSCLEGQDQIKGNARWWFHTQKFRLQCLLRLFFCLKNKHFKTAASHITYNKVENVFLSAFKFESKVLIQQKSINCDKINPALLNMRGGEFWC